MERGVGFKIAVFSLILILTVSFVSASFIGDILKQFFGVEPTPTTGFVTEGDGTCYDFDGADNFLEASKVTYNGNDFFDYCNGDDAYDYYCEGSPDEGGVNTGGTTSFLPLVPKITGQVVGGGDISTGDSPPSSSINCFDTYGVPCNSGRCGCAEGADKSCGETDLGECTIETIICSDGKWSECTAVFPETEEICGDGLDKDCDGKSDDDDPDADDYCKANFGPVSYCDRGECQNTGEGGGCNDQDNDGYDNCDIGQSGDDDYEIDCDDSNSAINPGATEVCDDGIDNDCDDLVDSADTEDCVQDLPDECTTGLTRDCGTDVGQCSVGLESCVDGQWSGVCEGNVGPSDEICDGLDNDCDESFDEGIDFNAIECQADEGTCLPLESLCAEGSFQTCSDLGYIAPADEETNDDGIDNNCNDLVDEGSACTDGDTRSCTPDQACKIGEQTCTDGVWGSTCEIVDDIPDCDVETACTAPDFQICGSNIGICFKGKKTCQSDGTWSECDAVLPETELCGDSLDNDCDGLTDESDCSTEVPSKEGQVPTQPDEDGEGTQTPTQDQGQGDDFTLTEDEKNFWRTILEILKAIANVGKAIVGYSINSADKIICLDSDQGKNYYQKGSGSGAVDNIEVGFQDFCYQNSQNSRVEKCGGENCFLKEYICTDEEKVTSETLKCEFGCRDGACIPDSTLSEENCKKFNKETWQWEWVC